MNTATTRWSVLWTMALITAMTSCDGAGRGSRDDAQNQAPSPPQPTAQASPSPGGPTTQPSSQPSAPTTEPSSNAATTTQGCGPVDELYAMDNRSPVPLQPMMAWHQKQNMMAHLQAIEGIVNAVASEDWDGVAAAAAPIESSPQMQQMCQHMGAGADGFTDMALEFHKRADKIALAARAKDSAGVLKATAHTLKACNNCHAAYRQDVVDAATWQARTGSQHKPGAGRQE